jgi:AcrR family transcriptional regulator
VTVQPKTERGRRTRERIVTAAAALFQDTGVEGTGLDDVLAAAQASKSQLYHYFRDKQDLVRAVIEWQSARVVDSVAERLAAVDSWQSLDAWFDDLVAYQQSRECRVGCPVGTLAAELSDRSEVVRTDLSAAFGQWRTVIRAALKTLQLKGHLRPEADTTQLATATLAAIQGGLLLAKTTRDPEQLRVSLVAVSAYLRTFAPSAA